MNLPPLIEFDGKWEEYQEKVYAAYTKYTAHAGLRFRGWKVSCRYHPESRGKGYGFWHCTQEGEIEEDRTPDFRRCERILWIPWVINNAFIDPRITWWLEEKRGDLDVLLWIEKEDYLVVLCERKDYYLLRTAYCTTKPHKRKSLLKERSSFWATQKTEAALWAASNAPFARGK